MVDRTLSNAYSHVFPLNDSPIDPPGPDKSEWAEFLGTYTPLREGASWTTEVTVRNGYLYLGETKCTEHEPGLFFTSDREALDFRSDPTTWANIPLRRVQAAPEQLQPDG